MDTGSSFPWAGSRLFRNRLGCGSTVPTTRISDDERRAALARRLAVLAPDGWQVESESEFQAVVVRVKRPNHILHLVLSVITLGLWLPVWLVLALKKKERGRMVLAVNEAGEVRGA